MGIWLRIWLYPVHEKWYEFFLMMYFDQQIFDDDDDDDELFLWYG